MQINTAVSANIQNKKFGMHAFAGNYSHDRRFARKDCLYHCGKSGENEAHIISGECEVYADIRNEFENLDDIETLTKFFIAVLKKRDSLQDDELYSKLKNLVPW